MGAAGGAGCATANLRTGSVIAVPPCFRDAAGTVPGDRWAIGMVATGSHDRHRANDSSVANPIVRREVAARQKTSCVKPWLD
jgi:hypothetical protein